MLAGINSRTFWEPSQMTLVLQGPVPLSKLGKLFDPRSGTNGYFPTTSQLH